MHGYKENCEFVCRVKGNGEIVMQSVQEMRIKTQFAALLLDHQVSIINQMLAKGLLPSQCKY